MFFPPFIFFFFFILVFLLFFVFALVQYGVFAFAFQRLGIPPEYLFSLLFLCILGSMINIPVMRVRLDSEPEQMEEVTFFGVRFRPPRWSRHRETVVAVNVGGAVIPVCISFYLLGHAENLFRILLALAVVTFVIYRLTRPVRGVGFAVPLFIPPILAAFSAVVLNPDWAPPTAYISGTLGTLLGADILHLDKLKTLNAPVASIGGAGTFDGIFLTGVLAVLLS